MDVEPMGVQPPDLPLPSQVVTFAERTGNELEIKAPKKRAETWVEDEMRTLIACRKEMGPLFSTCKSNKHLWEQISGKLKERGYDRSPTMCTDKWRNLVKEYKKAKLQHRPSFTKVGCYKDLDEVIGGRPAKHTPYRGPSKFGSATDAVPKESGKVPATLDRQLDGNGHIAASLLSNDSTLSNCANPHMWRDASANGGERHSPAGRVIVVRSGGLSRKIGIDGTAESIKEAIRHAFGLRSKRAIWLEDGDGIIRCFDRDMPLGTYNLNIDSGVTVKACIYDGNELTGAAEERVLYSEDDLREFLARRGWTSLREVGGCRDIENIDDLQPMGTYQRGGIILSTSL